MSTITEQVTDRFEECSKKFLSKLDYYKLALRVVLCSLSVITAIILAVITYSYKPIQDIATLKNEVINMNQKITLLINDSKEVIKSREEQDKNEQDSSHISVNALTLDNPALGAICATKD